MTDVRRGHGRLPLLEARGLYAGYGALPAVRDLNLVVYPGEIVALMGPDGAGKTTTLLTLGGALPALGGQVIWKGAATDSVMHRRVRGGMGFRGSVPLPGFEAAADAGRRTVAWAGAHCRQEAAGIASPSSNPHRDSGPDGRTAGTACTQRR